jgi:hypothetical protein
VFARGCRHGFARRHGRPIRHARWRVALWVVAIVALIAFEAFQFLRRATTATAVMNPLLAVPLVRIAALVWWARLGTQLTRT